MVFNGNGSTTELYLQPHVIIEIICWTQLYFELILKSHHILALEKPLDSSWAFLLFLLMYIIIKRFAHQTEVTVFSFGVSNIIICTYSV